MENHNVICLVHVSNLFMLLPLAAGGGGGGGGGERPPLFFDHHHWVVLHFFFLLLLCLFISPYYSGVGAGRGILETAPSSSLSK